MNLQMRRVVSVQQRNIGNPGFKTSPVRVSTSAVYNLNPIHGGAVPLPRRNCLETASVHSGTKCTSRWHGKQQERRLTITCAAQTSSAGFSFKDWDAITAKLVALSTVPFIFLLMPQIIKNAVNMLGGNTQALSILSWVGFTTALFGNTMLVSYFVDKKEKEAALIQSIGASSNIVMLAQIFVAGFVPAAVFWGLLAVFGTAAYVNGSKALGALEKSDWGPSLWNGWQDLLGLVGVALLPQAMWFTLAKDSSLLPGIICGISGLLFLILDKRGGLPKQLQGVWKQVPAWAATLLFMFQPLAQVISNFSDPSSLAGLSMATIILAATGNGLMMPRALFTSDRIWFTGSTWACLMMWVQLLSMYLGRAVDGTRFLGDIPFAVLSVIVFAFFTFVFQTDASTKGLPSPLSSLAQLGSTPDAKP